MTGRERTKAAAGRRRPVTTLIGLLLALGCVAVVVIALPDREGDRPCSARTVSSWTPDTARTDAFARYGDDGARTDDWTGGDGTHSVRLPDGRVLWLFSDTYLGTVHPPPNPVGQPHSWRDGSAPFVRNSAVVAGSSGEPERTVAAPLFPDTGVGEWRWPVAARVEARSPGSGEQVVRVLLWTRTAGGGPYIYGVPTSTEVATLSLPDLRLEGITQVLDQRQVGNPARRVLFGTTAVTGGDGRTYVFGGDDGQRPVHRAYVARVPDGRLGDPKAWEYWDGKRWLAGARPAPVLGDGQRRGVGSAFSVVRDAGTYVLFTMAAGASGLTSVTSYWACSPSGPWHGPAKALTPPLPRDAAAGQDTAAYNPQVHPELGGDGRLVLSYDVNWLDATAATAQAHISRNVSLYRPRFVSLRLARPG
ncbi:DUF4185 domain-containing protein [Streptomyces longispororuber]|uniref:DUF4185 domain-containing protein n=1 Tax=Streptomyces longispororuber TaxID=68230 RepID=UPI00210A4893|nr:DUF4185 domain-containing protein [Streptomyces longispororuber]MCQ4208655.1 DUF4185 domain-containing protein [Streptomyces longispororuber]